MVSRLFDLTVYYLSLPQTEADVVGCNVYSDGSVVAIDTWNPSYPRWNALDDDQVAVWLMLLVFSH